MWFQASGWQESWDGRKPSPVDTCDTYLQTLVFNTFLMYYTDLYGLLFAFWFNLFQANRAVDIPCQLDALVASKCHLATNSSSTNVDIFV